MADHGTSGSGTSRAPVDDAEVPWRVFLAIGLLVAVLAGIYWFTAYEDAGTVLLVLTAVLGLWYGIFLWLQQRRFAHAEAAGPEPPAEYLPHASVWPLAIGLGTALVLNGFVLGIWVMVPGVGLTLLGTIGFVRQTRRRD